MILLLFLCGVCFIVLANKIEKRKAEKSYCKEHQISEATYIRYDISTVKRLRYIWITCAILLCVNFVMVQFEDYLSTGILVVSGCLFYGLVPVGFLTIFLWLDGILYLKELKRYGYELPVHRKKVKFLQDLSRNEDFGKIDDAQQREKSVLVFGYICFGLFLLFAFLILKFYLKWNYTDITVVVIFLIIGDLIWLGRGVYTWIISDNRKYRYETIPDATKKKRPRLFIHIVFIMLYGAVSFFGMYMANSFARYAASACSSSDAAFCQELQSMAQDIYDENDGLEGEKWESSRSLLEAGTDLFSQSDSSDLFFEELLARSGYSSWTQIKEKFRLKDTTVSVYKEGDTIRVEYENPHVTDEGKPK